MVLLFVALAEVSRRARGGSRRLTEPRRSRGELIFVILPSKFHFAEQFAQQIARQIARQISRIG